MITVELIPILKDNYAYMLLTEDGICTIVDPGEAEPIIKFLDSKNLKPAFILNTHHHGDHTAGNAELMARYNAKIIAPEKEAHKISGVDQTVKAGDTLKLENETIIIMPAEGHTAGGVLYYFKDCHKIFVGDTLFSLGCGRLFEGTAEQMFSALQSIATLPDETLIYCGHEYTLANSAFCLSIEPQNRDIQNRIEEVKHLREKNLPTIPTTLALEKKTNVFLKAKSAEDFAALRQKKDNF